MSIDKRKREWWKSPHARYHSDFSILRKRARILDMLPDTCPISVEEKHERLYKLALARMPLGQWPTGYPTKGKAALYGEFPNWLKRRQIKGKDICPGY